MGIFRLFFLFVLLYLGGRILRMMFRPRRPRPNEFQKNDSNKDNDKFDDVGDYIDYEEVD